MRVLHHLAGRALGIAFCVLLTIAPFPAVSGDMDDALAAYEREDHAEALRLWRPLAERGDRLAQFWVGHMYRTGRGVERDMAEAIRWFRLSAAQNEPMAEYILAVLYYGGDGVPKDIDEAVRWLMRAAEHGDVEALGYVGDLYVRGEWTPADVESLRQWLRKVQDDGIRKMGDLDADPRFFIGKMHEVLETNEQQADLWYAGAIESFEPAAEEGDLHAQCMLYIMYATGRGAGPDREKAKYWDEKITESAGDAVPCLAEFNLIAP